MDLLQTNDVVRADVDVPRGADDRVRVRTTDPDAAVEGAGGAQSQGGRAPGAGGPAVAALVQAAGVQLQERTVHLPQMSCRLTIPVVSSQRHPRPMTCLINRSKI